MERINILKEYSPEHPNCQLFPQWHRLDPWPFWTCCLKLISCVGCFFLVSTPSPGDEEPFNLIRKSEKIFENKELIERAFKEVEIVNNDADFQYRRVLNAYWAMIKLIDADMTDKANSIEFPHWVWLLLKDYVRKSDIDAHDSFLISSCLLNQLKKTNLEKESYYNYSWQREFLYRMWLRAEPKPDITNLEINECTKSVLFFLAFIGKDCGPRKDRHSVFAQKRTDFRDWEYGEIGLKMAVLCYHARCRKETDALKELVDLIRECPRTVKGVCVEALLLARSRETYELLRQWLEDKEMLRPGGASDVAESLISLQKESSGMAQQFLRSIVRKDVPNRKKDWNGFLKCLKEYFEAPAVDFKEKP